MCLCISVEKLKEWAASVDLSHRPYIQQFLVEAEEKAKCEVEAAKHTLKHYGVHVTED